MHVLVAYATRHGATAGIAVRIAAALRAEGLDAEVRPVNEVDDLAAFDAVVLGGATYLSHWVKDATRFARRHRVALRDRPVWLFSSGPLGIEGVDDEGRDVRESSGPREFVELTDLLRPRDEHVFFGARDPGATPIGLGERLVRHIPAARGALPAGDFRNWEEIDAWARGIAAELSQRTGAGRLQHS